MTTDTLVWSNAFYLFSQASCKKFYQKYCWR